ncbi:MAG: NADH-quinone oxidoreductase subunit NuoF [Myxococcales bacterium]|nr:NADH-quinone oxidoreductase subunit NuoF [Myxococcales bacterium]
MTKLLTKHIHESGCETLNFYVAHGGYSALKKAFKMKPEEVMEEVKKASLRGRGGAGFPAGIKWSFVPKDSDKPKYLVVNADESEPGTFKDRLILEKMAHYLLEGIIISSYAVGIHHCYIYVRGEFWEPVKALQKALEEAYSRGYFGKNILGSGFDLECTIHRGAGAYICGEETGLLESLEGKPGRPRNKPPFPALIGAFGCPTVVNNVETIAYVPSIIELGAEKYLQMGPHQNNGGVKMYCISGHVKKPGVYELPMNTTLRQLIYDHAGGILGDRELKMVIPGGSSTPILMPDQIDVMMDFDELKKLGTFLGSAGTMIVAEGTDIVELAAVIAKFYAHESCGQCTPCREGTDWIYQLVLKIHAGEGTKADIDRILDICNNMKGQTICVLSDALADPMKSIVTKFRHEFEARVVDAA